MATSTYKTFLMYKASNSAEYSKLIDVTEVPDLGSAPEMLETTSLSDRMKTYIPGLQDTGNLAFVANYDPTDYATLDALSEEKDFAVWLGGTESGGSVTPTGSEGKFEFKGRLTVYLASQGTNAVRHMNISIAPSTVINFKNS